MDRARLGEPDAPPTEATGLREVGTREVLSAEVRDPLAEEMRHSALLLGWALGLMGSVAVLLLVLTTRFGG